jgi:hypothetical protein
MSVKPARNATCHRRQIHHAELVVVSVPQMVVHKLSPDKFFRHAVQPREIPQYFGGGIATATGTVEESAHSPRRLAPRVRRNQRGCGAGSVDAVAGVDDMAEGQVGAGLSSFKCAGGKDFPPISRASAST